MNRDTEVLSRISQSVISLIADMGLGKTLQTLGLILLNKPEAGSAGKATLIVSPVSAMANWAQQANQHVKKGHLNVCLYQGKNT